MTTKDTRKPAQTLGKAASSLGDAKFGAILPDAVAKKYSVVIADDHALMREGLRRIFDSFGNVEIVEEVTNGLDVIRAAKTRTPTLITLDLAMPYAHGADVLVEICRQSPSSRVAVVTGLASSALVAELTECGAHGLFLKTGSLDVLARGLRLVIEGGKFVAPEVVDLLESSPPPPELTRRERQTLSLIAQGMTNSEIADRLCISPKTVDKHRTSLMAKLGVHSMSELLSYALREGLLDASKHINQ